MSCSLAICEAARCRRSKTVPLYLTFLSTRPSFLAVEVLRHGSERQRRAEMGLRAPFQVSQGTSEAATCFRGPETQRDSGKTELLPLENRSKRAHDCTAVISAPGFLS